MSFSQVREWRQESFYDFNWIFTDLAIVKALAKDGLALVSAVQDLAAFFNQSQPSSDLFGVHGHEMTLNDFGTMAGAVKSTPNDLLLSQLLDR